MVNMAFVICEPCTKTNYCYDACPYYAIRPSIDDPDYDQQPQLYINPARCTDCGLCVGVCPEGAIYPGDSVPGQWFNYIAINADYF
jgi:ferredoxin